MSNDINSDLLRAQLANAQAYAEGADARAQEHRIQASHAAEMARFWHRRAEGLRQRAEGLRHHLAAIGQPALDERDSTNEAMACAQIERDQAAAGYVPEPLPATDDDAIQF